MNQYHMPSYNCNYLLSGIIYFTAFHYMTRRLKRSLGKEINSDYLLTHFSPKNMA